MACFGGTRFGPNRRASPGNMHFDGVFCAFSDVSAHWISDYIEVSITINKPSAWDELSLSLDDLVLSPIEYQLKC